MKERRESPRYKALETIAVAIQAEDEDRQTEGMVLNISKDGAYIFANSIPFQTADVDFRLPDGTSIRRRCRRIYPHQPKARGLAIAFAEPLAAEELEAIKAPIE